MTAILPPVFDIRFEEFRKNKEPHVRVFYEDHQIGDPLNDNFPHNDGYRYHDAFHFSYFLYHGSSHVVDHLLTVQNFPKAKERLARDPREFEECASIMTFALRHEGSSFLCKRLEEISADFPGCFVDRKKWKMITQDFYTNFDLLYANRGGIITCDTVQKKMTYRKA